MPVHLPLHLRITAFERFHFFPKGLAFLVRHLLHLNYLLQYYLFSAVSENHPYLSKALFPKNFFEPFVYNTYSLNLDTLQIQCLRQLSNSFLNCRQGSQINIFEVFWIKGAYHGRNQLTAALCEFAVKSCTIRQNA